MQGTSQTLELDFGGTKVLVDTPENSHDELTGLPMIPSEVSQAMKVEIEELERLKVGTVLSESEGRRLGKENKVQVLTSRWVIAQKAPGLARRRLVVRDFATGFSLRDLFADIQFGWTSRFSRGVCRATSYDLFS